MAGRAVQDFMSKWRSPVVIALHWLPCFPHSHRHIWLFIQSKSALPRGVDFCQEQPWGQVILSTVPCTVASMPRCAGRRTAESRWNPLHFTLNNQNRVSVPEYWEHAAPLLRHQGPYSQPFPISTIPPWIPSQDTSPVLPRKGLRSWQGQWIWEVCELREGHWHLTGSNPLVVKATSWDRAQSRRKAERRPPNYLRIKLWPHKYYCCISLPRFTH